MLLTLWSLSLAAAPVEISDQTTRIDLTNGVTYLNGEAGDQNPSDLIHSNEFTEQLTKLHKPSLTTTSIATTWSRFQLKNIGPNTSLYYLTYSDKLAIEIEVYTFDGSQIIAPPQLGGRTYQGKSESVTFDSAFTMNIPVGETRTILTKVTSQQTTQLIPKISSPRDFMFENARSFIFFGLKNGAAVATILGVLIFLGRRNFRSFLSYIVYFISLLMVLNSKETWSHKYFGQSFATWIANNAVEILLFCVAARAFFCTNKLQTKTKNPKGHKMLAAIIATATLMIVIATVMPTANVWMWAARLTAVSLLASIAIAYHSVQRGNESARYYLVGSLFFTLFAGISGAAEFGFLPYSKIVQLSHFLGPCLEMLSLGIGHANDRRAREAAEAHEKTLAVQKSEQLAVLTAQAHEREISAEFNDSIISKLPVPLVLIGTDLRVIRVNERFILQFCHDKDQLQKLFSGGHTVRVNEPSVAQSEERSDEPSYRPLHDLQNFRQKSPELFSFLTEALASNEASTNFLLQNLFYGEKRVFQVNSQRIISPRDNNPQLLLAVEDLTAVYKLNHSMQLATEAAKQHSASKSNFLANMSHEIRTPLAVIIGYAGLLDNDGKNLELKKSYLSKIKKSSHHLLALVDEVLDVSKIEAGKLEINPMPTNLLEELSDTMAILSSRAKENGLKFNIEFLGKIPRKITTNPLRLRQILINVIGNAAKFTNCGGVQVKVSMTSEKCLTFEVTDTGCGMTALQQQSLFQPFEQGDSSISRKYGGTGLGLALSRHLAQAMGGNIELAWSIINEGSCFVIEIDPGEISDLREVNHAAWETGDAPLALRQSLTPQMPNVRVLLVEDSPELRELVTIYLEATGAQIDIAVNGADAISRCMVKSYDVILMDIQMPILDGYQAADKLLGLGYPAPIIALTAHAMTTERDVCFAKGFSDYLSKPVTPQNLFAALVKHTSIAANSRN